MALGLLGLIAGAVVLLYAGGNISTNYVLGAPEINAFGIGILALALGPSGYFLGKSAQGRIAGSAGSLGGLTTARAATFIGIAATVMGAASTLLWLVVLLLGYFGPPPAG
jgi:hypothetical protein